MAKTKISEFDSNPANNTDIDGINLAEGMAPGLVNNAIRELMAQLKDLQSGTAGDSWTIGGNLSVTGASTFTGNATFNGTVSIGSNAVDSLPSGTRMAFAQASAPTGWTQITTDTADNRMLRVVNTAGGGTGGSNSPILNNVVPSHTHTYSATTSGVGDHVHGFGAQVQTQNDGSGPFYVSSGVYQYGLITQTQGAGAHSHTVSGTTAANPGSSNWTPRYIDMIICSKN